MTLFHQDRLLHVESKLQNIVKEVGKSFDICVVCGFRGEIEQNDAFQRGNSKLKYPNSKHNKSPSLAVDLAPCDCKGSIDWQDVEKFVELSKLMLAEAAKQRVKLVWGGSFKKFVDMPHFEL